MIKGPNNVEIVFLLKSSVVLQRVIDHLFATMISQTYSNIFRSYVLVRAHGQMEKIRCSIDQCDTCFLDFIKFGMIPSSKTVDTDDGFGRNKFSRQESINETFFSIEVAISLRVGIWSSIIS